MEMPDGKMKKISSRLLKTAFFCGMAAIFCISSYKNVRNMTEPDGTSEALLSESDSASEALLSESDSASEALVSEPDGALPPQRNLEEAGQISGQVSAVGAEAGNAEEQKTVALTFDDGPHPVYTKKLLDGLKERKVQATFFVVGKNIPGNEDLILQMKEDGHLIGNHTYDHVKICDLSGREACEQVEKTSQLVFEITGENTEFVRPPFGAWNKDMECSFVMLPVLWDVDPLDWTTRNTELIVQRVLEEVEDGDIVLLHDYYDSSVEAAFRIIDALQAQGYTFVTADQMLLE